MGKFFDSLGVAWQFVKIKQHSKKIIRRKHYTVPDMFAKSLATTPNGYIAFENRQLSYRELDQLSNQIAHWLYSQGVGPGTVVPLVMKNCPEYIAFWLGLAKIGAAAALINTNLREQSLVHCLLTAFEQSKLGPKMVIVGLEYAEIFNKEVQVALLAQFSDVSYHTYAIPNAKDGEAVRETSKNEGEGSINALIAESPKTAVNRSVRASVTFADPLYYIYTSGTTGLPKAAKIPHLRFMVGGYAFKTLYRYRSGEDMMYIPLPIYHSNGGMVGVASCWSAGISFALREKFSANGYFEDCRKYGCTLGVYIGEICRYILNTPEKFNDKDHPVRMMIGNGLRPEVWKQFVERFGVVMGEFYGSTEGNANLFNNQTTLGSNVGVGAVGYLPSAVRGIYPVKFIRVDSETSAPIRDAPGLCQLCGPEEPGELVGLINDRDATRRFDGYTDRQASERKILTDVVKKGDRWFRTGDLLKYDKDGFVYFVDRIGDTFRWKGENCSTREIEKVVSSVPGVLDVNVYGVEVGNLEGKAGMAVIETGLLFSLEDLYEKLVLQLPSYARPLFIRETSSKDNMTGTFKHKKTDLVKLGFDPEKSLEPIWFRSEIEGRFVQMTPRLYREIVNGEVRV